MKNMLAILFVAGLLFALFWSMTNRSVVPDQIDGPAASEPMTTPSSSSAADRRSSTGASPLPPSQRTRPAPGKELLIEPGDALWAHESEEGRQWLNEHGFPSEAVLEEASAWAAVNGLAGGEYFARLHRITALDMAKAQAFALLHPEDSAAAIEYLELAAAGGSIQALHALAGLFGHPAHGPNPVAAAAFHRAAELRGDWTAVLFRGLVPLKGLSEQERMIADLQAFNILREINQLRAEQGLLPLEPSMRPGLPDTAELMEWWQEQLSRLAEEGSP